MSPKEKAKELIDKMYNTENCGIKHFPNKNYCDCTEINLFQAKQCGLIAVDEIIKLDVFDCNEDWSDQDGDTREYWQEVKKEIEKL